MSAWNTDERRNVSSVLLGSWPGTIKAWGRTGFAAYVNELEARNLTAEQVVTAVRTWPAGSDFPPSAPNLAAAARTDPSKPTFVEALVLIRAALKAWNKPLHGDFDNEAQMLKARHEQVEARASSAHPLVASFIVRYGVTQLLDDVAELDDDQYGALRRKALRDEWDRHCEAQEGREVAQLVGRRRGELGRFDPLVTFGRQVPAGALDAGENGEGT